MTAGPFKRLASFAVDFVLIISVVFITWIVFAEAVLQWAIGYESGEDIAQYTAIAYHYLGFTIVNYIYQVVSQGRTFGRRFVYLTMSGQVNWWSLFMREVIWKCYLWLFAVTFISIDYFLPLLFVFPFLFFIDFLLIAFTRTRKTIRDRVTHTKIILEDVVYPF